MELDIRLVQNKVCHPVEEIRTRTVNSLLYKLEQNLVDPVSLVNETQLFKALIKSLGYGGPSTLQVNFTSRYLSANCVGFEVRA